MFQTDSDIWLLLLRMYQGTGPSIRQTERVETHSFHGQTIWAKLHDLNDAMELWALGPHVIFVTVIYTLGSRRTFQSDLALCGLHEFLRLNVADIQEGISEKVSGKVFASPLLLDMTVMSSSGVIVSPSDVPVGKILLLTTVVSTIDAVSMVTPFVVPPPPDIERPVMQAQDFSNCRLTKSREFLSSFRLSASSPAPMLLRDSAQDSALFFSLDRVPPLRGNKSPPAGEALLQPPADDCVVSDVDVPNTAGRCELFPGSESLCSLPACATVRSVLSAGPSGRFSGSLRHCRRDHRPMQRP